MRMRTGLGRDYHHMASTGFYVFMKGHSDNPGILVKAST